VRKFTGFGGAFFLSVVLLSAMAVGAQESPTAAKPPCVRPDETIYHAGVDGVIPPQLQPDKNGKNAPEIRGSISLELLVNGEGRVCDVRILKATDQSSARNMASFIARSWIFKPATKQGKPVAVKFETTFNVPE